MKHLFSRFFILGAINFLGWLPIKSAAQSEPAKTYSLNIEAQSLDRAIRAFALKTGVSVNYSGRSLKRLQSSQISGTLTLDEFFSRVLSDTNFEHKIVSERAVSIVKRQYPVRTISMKIPDSAESPRPKPASFARLVSTIEPVKADEIIVTAMKRSNYHTVQNAPYSIQRTSGDTLSAINIGNAEKLTQYVAGSGTTNLGPSENKLFLRGISDGAFTGRLPSTVGFYFNETPINYNAPYPEIPLLDVESVEILKGPQGALYGAGALGGVYRINTEMPDANGDFGWVEGEVALTKKGAFSEYGRVMLNKTIVPEKFALRILGYAHNQGGYIYDVGLGVDDINETQTLGGRVSFAAEPSSEWDIRATLSYQDLEVTGAQYALASLPGLQRSSLVAEPHNDEFAHFGFDLTRRFGWGDAISSTSFVKRRIFDQVDGSEGLPINFNRPVEPSTFVESRDINLLTHETRINFNIDDTFEVLSGVFFSVSDEKYASDFRTLNSQDLLLREDREEDASQVALFSDIDFTPTQRLTLAAGVRWTHSNLETESSLSTAQVPSFGMEASKKESRVLPRFNLSYHISDDVLVFAQASSSFRAGGINLNSPQAAFILEDELDNDEDDDELDIREFDADKLQMFEVGVKSSWMEDRLNANLSGYVVDWNDIQSEQILPSGFTAILNVGDARNIGFDADVSGVLNDKLKVSTHLSWTDPDVKNINPFLTEESDQNLPSVPHWSGSLIATYTDTISSLDATFLGSLDFSFNGQSQLTFSRSDNLFQGPNESLNLNVAILTDDWRVAGYIDNVLDTRENTFSFGNPFSFRRSLQTTPPRPRTVGVKVRKLF